MQTQKELSSAKDHNRHLEMELAKSHAECDRLTSSSEYLRKVLDALSIEKRSFQEQIARLEVENQQHCQKVESAEKDRQVLLSEIFSLKEARSVDTDHQSLLVQQELAALRSENKRLQNENERMSAREDRVEEMEEGRDWLESMVDFAAQQCGQGHLLKVDRREYERVKEELEVLRIETKERKVRDKVLKRELSAAAEEIIMLGHKLEGMEISQDELERTIDDLLEQRRADRDISEMRGKWFDEDHFVDSPDVTANDIAVLEDRHATLSLLVTQQELRQVLNAYRHFLTKYEDLKETLTTTQYSHINLERQHKELGEDLRHLESTHQACGISIAGLNGEVARWQHAEQALSTELEQVKAELKRTLAATRGDKEALKRANEGVLRSKAAEDAFEEEIFQFVSPLVFGCQS